jgi:hypothetical protein
MKEPDLGEDSFCLSKLKTMQSAFLCTSLQKTLYSEVFDPYFDTQVTIH